LVELTALTGPAADGRMSNSKICVGNHKVAQAFLNIDHAADVTLHRRRAEDRVGLRARVAELGQILDRVQACLPVRDVHVEVVLLARLVDQMPSKIFEKLGVETRAAAAAIATRALGA
jgi:hypothetical protein